MGTNLPTDVDATYPDRSPGDKTHQQMHDTTNAYTNTHDTAVDPHGDRAYAAGLSAYKGVRVGLSAVQSIPTATSTAILFNTERWDDGGWHDNAVNPSRLTVPAGLTGKFLLAGAFAVFGTSGTYREARIHKNGVVDTVVNFSPAQWARYLILTEVSATAGDYFEMLVQHDASTALNAETDTYLVAHYLGAP